MLTDLLLGYFWSTFTFSETNSPVCAFNIPNERSLHEDYSILSYCYKRAINSRVIGLGNWCVRPKSRQRGGTFKSPSQVFIFQEITTFELLGDAQMVFWIFYITPKFYPLNFC